MSFDDKTRDLSLLKYKMHREDRRPTRSWKDRTRVWDKGKRDRSILRDDLTVIQ